MLSKHTTEQGISLYQPTSQSDPSNTRPNFDIRHACRGFEAIRDLAVENIVADDFFF